MMLSALRKYFSKSISPIDLPEVFPWQGWLKRTPNEKHSIGEILIYLDNTDFIDLHLDQSSINYVFLFNKSGEEENINYINFGKTKTSPVFYTFYKTRIDNFGFEPIKVLVSNFTEFIIQSGESLEEHKFVLEADINIRSISFFDALPKVIEKDYASVDVTISNIELNDKPVKTIDCLSQFVPNVEKHSLLSEKDLMNVDESFKVLEPYNQVKLDMVKISTLKNLEFYYDAPMMSYNNINFKDDATYSFAGICLDEIVKVSELKDNVVFKDKSKSSVNLIKNIDGNLNHKHLFQFLEPRTELTENEIDFILGNLNSYHRRGAAFLFNNKYAVLCNKYEVEKEIQIVNALKLINKVHAARKILLITSKEDSAKLKYHDKELFHDSWRYCFNKYAPKINPSFICDDNSSVTKDELLAPGVLCVTIDKLKSLIAKKRISKKELQLFDAFICSDLDQTIIEDDFFRSLLLKTEFKYSWFISNFRIQEVMPFFNKINLSEEIKVLDRIDEDISEVVPVRNEENYFFNMDGNLQIQYDVAMEEGKDRIGLVMQAGNLLRFQPNVFQLYHQLQQQTNFIKGSVNSPKAKMLKRHIKKILASNNRLLLYTQFDNHGLVPFQEILAELKIDYIRFDSSDSAKSIREKIVKGSEFSGKLVYITNLKPKAIQFNFPDVAHVIHFDSWWNPFTRWEVESKLSPKRGENIFIYNYYYNETIEGTVAKKIMEYGTFDVDPLFNTSPEQFYGIINEDYWHKILDIKIPVEIPEEIGDDESEEAA
jgi:hypothetical protein